VGGWVGGSGLVLGGWIYERGKDTTPPVSLLSVAAISGSQIRELPGRSHETSDVYNAHAHNAAS